MKDQTSSPPLPRRLGVLAVIHSSECIYVLLALLLSLGFWLATQAYWVPSARNNDANAYILGGRALADGHWRGVKAPDPYVYFGQHWVTGRKGLYQLKFSTGLPLLYAIIRWIGGSANWPADAYQLSPVVGALAVFGSFLLFRAVTNGFYAFFGAIALAASPETLFFAEKPNSHACSLCVVVWGMYFLMRWWQTKSPWRGLLAGLILGFNFTVRYSEGLLLLPIFLVTIFAFREQRKRAMIPLLGWLIPFAAQTLYNEIVLHHFSGYGLTNESTAFSPHYFLQYWPAILTGLYDQCLFFILPLSVVGAIVMLATDWRLGLVICSWFAPPILLYTAYYWSPDNGGPATLPYLRFLITVIPALVLTAVWLLHQLGSRLNSPLAMLAAGLVVSIALISEIDFTTSNLAQLQWNGLGGMLVAQNARKFIPPGSLIFAEGHDMVLLEELGDWRLYVDDLFTTQAIAPFGRVNQDAPQELQPERSHAMYALLGGLNDQELAQKQNDLMRQALATGHHIYAILPADACRRFCKRYVNGRGFNAQVVSSWILDAKWETQYATSSVAMQLISIQ